MFSQSPDLISIVVPILIVLASLSIHEAAHAWTADRLGDPTARMLGRVSLNPVVHIDPIGTLLLPLLAVWSGLPIIGWAKPVPVNLSRLAQPRRDFMIVAAAGPVSNLLLAVVGAVVYRGLVASIDPLAATSGPYGPDFLARVCAVGVQINVMLAFFNLIPVPPLDGGNVLAGLLPERAAQVLDLTRAYGFIILYALMFSGMLGALIAPPTNFVMRLLIP